MRHLRPSSWCYRAACSILLGLQISPPNPTCHTKRQHPRRSGYPFGTLVDFASDGAGMPIFCLSPLAIHARNLIEDPRCSLVVQMPGWTGLANARVTIFGDVYQLPAHMQVWRVIAFVCVWCGVVWCGVVCVERVLA